MQRLPSPEERQWIVDALKTLVAKRGVETLDTAPLVEPTNTWFPEPWSATAAHGHRLAQRLLYYAGLRSLRPTLSAYEPQWNDDGTAPWDAGTAGWFAGITEGRAHFGLHVRQFSDPEAAAGVLAHEVAHAWRTHHRLVVEDRDEEEHLTDITTVILGFGILSTNNTNRYRSSGNWSVTTWSISSAGYLPPQAMAYALALWTAARGNAGERKAIERHLEPNQLGFFRAALEELASEKNPRRLLGIESQAETRERVRPQDFAPDDPASNEIDEPEYDETPVNAGRMVYRKAKGSPGTHAYFGAIIGFFLGATAGLLLVGEKNITSVGLLAAVGAVAGIVFMLFRSRSDVCSDCETAVAENVAICSGCGGTLGRRVSTRELRQLREEELEQRAARDVEYDECDECEPERPCPKHKATERFGPVEDEPEPELEIEVADDVPARSGGGPSTPLRITALLLVAAALVVTIGLAWWRRSHVPVYFDNALDRPLTLQVDGATFPFEGRLSVVRQLKPGRHSIIVRDQGRELERFDANIPAQNLLDALRKPRFFVYNAGAAGIYESSTMVYSTIETERSTESNLIGLERWIEHPDADYVFRAAPLEVASSKATLTAFDIARDFDFRDLAYVWLGQGRNDDALRALKKGLESNPCDDDMHGDVVALLAGTGEEERATAEATAWVAACDGSVAAHRALQNRSRTDALLARYRERVQRDPSAANHYLYARLLHGPAAIAGYRESLRIDPDFTWARVGLGYEMLIAERDAEAFAILEETLEAEDVPDIAPLYYAMSAVGDQRIDDALKRIAAATSLHPEHAWQATWILTHAKSDWDAARVLIADREQGERTPETTILRAKIDWESGGALRDQVIADLRRDPKTAEAASMLALEDALENGRFAEAARMEKLPELYAVYAAHAGVLAGSRVDIELREPILIALRESAEGRMDAKTLLRIAAETDVRYTAHAWFALAVRAAANGDRAEASRLFGKSASRALDREFPYRVAMKLAEGGRLAR